jgi:hypothetical protein
VTDADSLTAADLTRILHVSRASISKAVGYLSDVGMLQRERGSRREHYSIGHDVWTRVGMVKAGTGKMLAATARRGAETLGPTTPAGTRLADMAWCFETLYSLDPQGIDPQLSDLLGSVPCRECGAHSVSAASTIPTFGSR